VIPDGTQVTRLLRRVEAGDAEASCALVAALYEELHAIAERAMARQPDAITLQPTALVHEAWIKLFRGESAGAWHDRRHFVNAAAQAMRQVLIDQARRRQAAKRGHGRRPAPLELCVELMEEAGADLLALDEALEELAALDPELARLVELRFFAGLTIPQVAEVLGGSASKVDRSWRAARAWLRGRLSRS
jgi:RNA polymerase sigma factor (TIGR02999 family)